MKNSGVNFYKSSKEIFTIRVIICSIALLTSYAEVACSEGVNKSSKKIQGFIQTDFYQGNGAEKPHGESTFHVRRARLGLKGKALPKLKYNLLVAYDGADVAAEEVKTFNAFVNYSITDVWSVTAGQFKYSFDREGRPAAHGNPFIFFSLPTQKIIGKLGSQGSAFRDVGIEVSARIESNSGKRTDLFVGLINGSGINQAATNDGQQDTYFRLTTDLMPGFNVGGSYFYGKVLDSLSNVLLSERIWTADINYAFERVNVSGAIISADYEQSLDQPAKNPNGYYIAAVYRHSKKFDFLVRHQEFEANSASQDTGVQSLDFGLNYYFKRVGKWGGTRLSFNYSLRSAQSNGSTKLWHDRGPKLTGDSVGNLFAARIQLTL